jgi:polyisoprenoid-binding protein YceI
MTVCYTLTPEDSRFTVQAFAGGLLSVFAHDPVSTVREFTGQLCFTPETFADATLTITVRADSLELTAGAPDKDRQEIETTMRKEVLETAAYPEIRFRSATMAATKIADNWYRLRIRGELTLHGVQHTQEIDSQLRLLDDGIRLSGEFGLALSAYRIKRVTALAGMIKLKDEVEFSFDLAGRAESAATAASA